jgi:hypothetical protein
LHRQEREDSLRIYEIIESGICIGQKIVYHKNVFYFATEGHIISAMKTFAFHRQHYARWALWAGITETQQQMEEKSRSNGAVKNVSDTF